RPPSLHRRGCRSGGRGRCRRDRAGGVAHRTGGPAGPLRAHARLLGLRQRLIPVADRAGSMAQSRPGSPAGRQCRLARHAGGARTWQDRSVPEQNYEPNPPLEKSIAQRLQRNDQGLVCAVVQDDHTLEVLMVAWMDDEALRRTLTEGRVTYWSRSRGEYWRKG